MELAADHYPESSYRFVLTGMKEGFSVPPFVRDFVRNMFQVTGPSLDLRWGPDMPKPSPVLYTHAVAQHAKAGVTARETRKLETRGHAVATNSAPAAPGGKGKIRAKTTKFASLLRDWYWQAFGPVDQFGAWTHGGKEKPEDWDI